MDTFKRIQKMTLNNIKFKSFGLLGIMMISLLIISQTSSISPSPSNGGETEMVESGNATITIIPDSGGFNTATVTFPIPFPSQPTISLDLDLVNSNATIEALEFHYPLFMSPNSTSMSLTTSIQPILPAHNFQIFICSTCPQSANSLLGASFINLDMDFGAKTGASSGCIFYVQLLDPITNLWESPSILTKHPQVACGNSVHSQGDQQTITNATLLADVFTSELAHFRIVGQTTTGTPTVKIYSASLLLWNPVAPATLSFTTTPTQLIIDLFGASATYTVQWIARVCRLGATFTTGC
jgi:hypothetical protein